MKNYRIKKITYDNGDKFYYPQYRCIFWHNYFEDGETVKFDTQDAAKCFLYNKLSYENKHKAVKEEIINI